MQLEIVWSSLWVSKLFAKALPWIFQALVGVVSASVKKYSLVIRALEIPLSLGRRPARPPAPCVWPLTLPQLDGRLPACARFCR